MATVAQGQSNVCPGGCGRTVPGKGKCGACRQRAHRLRPEKPIYPKYLDTFSRLDRCDKHGEIFVQVGHQFLGTSLGNISATTNQRPQYQPCEPVMWTGGCEQCQAEEKARIEGLKPKPRSACEAGTCDCSKSAPKCPACGKPMRMGGSELPGFHNWSCADFGYAQEQPSWQPGQAQNDFTPQPFRATGTHSKTASTPWRNQ